MGQATYPEDLAGKVAAVTVVAEMGMALFQEIGLAVDHGPAGLILVLDPAIPPEAVLTIVPQVIGLPPQPIPVLGVLRRSSAALLAAAGDDIDAVLPPLGAEAGSIRSGGSPTEVEVTIGMHRKESRPPTVVGCLPAQIQSCRTPIWSSARTSITPRPSVRFLGVSGEEKGLLGARQWAEAPTVPIDRIVANINTDMVGRTAPDIVIAIGAEFTTLGKVSRAVAATHPEPGLVIGLDPVASQNLFVRSDHVAFVQQQIPAIAYTNGCTRTIVHPRARPRRSMPRSWRGCSGSPPWWAGRSRRLPSRWPGCPGASQQVAVMLRSLPFRGNAGTAVTCPRGRPVQGLDPCWSSGQPAPG
ncbi:MAG: M28 family peptidase [Gemmatimonadota bacterium]